MHTEALELATGDLESWGDRHYEQLPLLAHALVEALGFWPTTIDTISVLAQASSIRDALLDEQPQLVNQALEKAVSSTEDFDRLSPLCVAFLSRQLPEGVGLPASAHNFFIGLFGRASSKPCMDTVRALYDVLNGACASLPDLLSPEELMRFEDDLKTMMRAKEKLEDQLVTMLCILIAAKMPQLARRSASQAAQISFASGSGHQRGSGGPRYKLFWGEHGLRTMRLVSLQVIHACRKDAGVEEACMHIHVAREIAMQMDSNTVTQFLESKTQIAQKLWQKLTQNDLPLAVRVEALAFATSLTPNKWTENDVVNCFKACTEDFDALLSTSDRVIASFCQSLSMLQSRSVLAQESSADMWSPFCICCFYAMQRLRHSNARQASNLGAIFRKLDAMTSTSIYVRNALVQLGRRLSHDPNFPVFLNSDIPKQAAQRGAELRFVRLMLHSAKVTPKTEHQLSVTEIEALVIRQQRIQMFASTVVPPAGRPSALPALLASGPELPGDHQHSWKDALKTLLDRQGNDTYSSMLGLVGQAVEGLEARCEDVEAPLRSEREARVEADQKYKQLAETLKAREDLLESKKHEFQAITNAEHRLKDDLSEARSELDTNVNLVAELELQLQDAQEAAKVEMEQAESSHHSRVMELQTRVATQEEHIWTLEKAAKDTDADLTALRSELLAVQSALNEAEKKIAVADEHSQALHDENARLSSEITELHRTLEEKCNSYEALEKAQVEELQAASLHHNQEKHELLQEHEKTRTNLFERITRLEADLDAGESKQNDLMHDQEAKTAHYESVIADKESAIRDLQQEADAGRNTAAHLASKIHHLEGECKSKEQELKKAHGMRAGMLKMLGIDNQGLESAAPEQLRTAAAEIRAISSDDLPEISPPESRLQVPATTKKGSSTQLKQQPFKQPSRKSARASTSSSSRDSERLGRMALANVSPNRRLEIKTPRAAKGTLDSPSVRRSLRVSKSRTPVGGQSQQENQQGLWADLSGMESNDFDDTTSEL